jgi:short-subunit dehydrogenase involved in D-alanine esterification of teichoic acids
LQTILITGVRAPIALETSRSFAQFGHQVIVADSQYLTIARWSNTVRKYYKLPLEWTKK